MYTIRFLLFTFCLTLGIACTPVKPISYPKNGFDKKNAYTKATTNPFRERVVDYGMQFVGTTYKYAGQSPETGFDCSGFTSYVLKETGVPASPSSAIQATEGRYVDLDQVLPGDLIFFGESTNKISHVALVVSRGPEGITCVHSTTSRGVVVENVSQSAYWNPKILFSRDLITDN